MRRGLTVQIID